MKESTGTMHYSESVALRLAHAAPAVIVTDVEKGILAPEDLFFPKNTGMHSAIVFGYTSWGSGEETLHVFLLANINNVTVVTDHLEMNVKRGDGGFIWTDQKKLFVIRPAEEIDGDEAFLKSNTTRVSVQEERWLGFAVQTVAGVLLNTVGASSPADFKKQRMVEIPIKDGKFDIHLTKGH